MYIVLLVVFLFLVGSVIFEVLGVVIMVLGINVGGICLKLNIKIICERIVYNKVYMYYLFVCI